MQHIPFAPWMLGTDALELVRNADGPTRSVAALTYYSAVLRAHEQLTGEIWSAEAWVGAARSHVMRGALREAEMALVQAGMMGTPDPDAALLMAEILLQTERAERAHRLLTKLVERRPHLARARYLLGLACRELDLPDEELAAYRAAVEIDPDLTEAWYRLGNHLSLRRNSAEAIAAWREVLRVDPGHEWTLCNLGLNLHRAGDSEGASECLARLRELDRVLADFLELGIQHVKPVPPGVRLRQYPRPSRKEGKGA